MSTNKFAKTRLRFPLCKVTAGSTKENNVSDIGFASSLYHLFGEFELVHLRRRDKKNCIDLSICQGLD
jgi:hypothetical protein